jgi:hypothetical protein
MSEDKEVRVQRPSGDNVEKRSAETVAAVVSAGAAVANVGITAWNVHQQGKPQNTPSQEPPAPSIELPPGVDDGK